MTCRKVPTTVSRISGSIFVCCASPDNGLKSGNKKTIKLIHLNTLIKFSEKLYETRKSSCVNARGILPATQQVFTVLICPGWGGGEGFLPWLGVPTLARGYLPRGGVLTLARGVPTLSRVPTGCGQTDPCENHTFSHPSDAGGN